MKTIFLIVPLLHVVIATDQETRWDTHKDDRAEVSLKENPSPKAPVFVLIIKTVVESDNTAASGDYSPAKSIGRAQIREIADIRHDPAFSSHRFMKRRMQRCHIRRRICIYGECDEIDIECIHECRVKFNACYRLPTYDDDFPAYPKPQIVPENSDHDITFENIMAENGNAQG